MKRSLAALYLPLRPRAVSPALAVIAASYPFVGTQPAAFIHIGAPGTVPRSVTPFEYVPMLLAITLCVGLAPRFRDWDGFGAVRTRHLALTNAIVTVAVPVLVFFSLLTLYPADAYPPATALVPIAGNVAFAALIAVCLVGLFGPLVGTLSWGAIIFGVMTWQSSAPAALGWGPLSMAVTAQGHIDTQTRWGWIAIGIAGSLAVACGRRSVPLRFTVRSADEP